MAGFLFHVDPLRIIKNTVQSRNLCSLSIDAITILKKLTTIKPYMPFILLAVLLILTSCTPTPELQNEAFLQDTSLISGEPCEAPCWQGLTPGETIWGIAQDFVKNNEDYTILNEVQQRRERAGQIEFALNDGPQCCRILTRDGEMLTAILLLLSPDMQLGDVIDRYGEPSYVTGESVTEDQSTIALVFPDIPMVTYIFAENLTDSELSEASKVIGVMYLAQSEMETLLQSESLYHWEGYGALGSLFDGEFDITPQPVADE